MNCVSISCKCQPKPVSISCKHYHAKTNKHFIHNSPVPFTVRCMINFMAQISLAVQIQIRNESWALKCKRSKRNERRRRSLAAQTCSTNSALTAGWVKLEHQDTPGAPDSFWRLQHVSACRPHVLSQGQRSWFNSHKDRMGRNGINGRVLTKRSQRSVHCFTKMLLMKTFGKIFCERMRQKSERKGTWYCTRSQTGWGSMMLDKIHSFCRKP